LFGGMKKRTTKTSTCGKQRSQHAPQTTGVIGPIRTGKSNKTHCAKNYGTTTNCLHQKRKRFTKPAQGGQEQKKTSVTTPRKKK